MFAFVQAFTSSSAFCARRTGQFMLDCPVQSHTSPKSTLAIDSFRPPPSTTTVCGPPAANGPTFVIQRPSAPAIACAAGLPSTEMEILSPGLAQPQIGAAMSRCNTMSLVNSGWRKGIARGCTGHQGCGPAGWATVRASASTSSAVIKSAVRKSKFMPKCELIRCPRQLRWPIFWSRSRPSVQATSCGWRRLCAASAATTPAASPMPTALPVTR